MEKRSRVLLTPRCFSLVTPARPSCPHQFILRQTAISRVLSPVLLLLRQSLEVGSGSCTAVPALETCERMSSLPTLISLPLHAAPILPRTLHAGSVCKNRPTRWNANWPTLKTRAVHVFGRCRHYPPPLRMARCHLSHGLAFPWSPPHMAGTMPGSQEMQCHQMRHLPKT